LPTGKYAGILTHFQTKIKLKISNRGHRRHREISHEKAQKNWATEYTPVPALPWRSQVQAESTEILSFFINRGLRGLHGIHYVVIARRPKADAAISIR